MELHLEAKVVGKGSKGRTACGSSAYRACDRLKDLTGRIHNYRHKPGYATGGIELPEGAPAELLDRQILWARHEAKDIRKDAELFREVVVALPNELDYEAGASVMRKLSKPLTDRGMCVQWDIHDITNRGQRNLHAHMMITMRTLQEDGTFGNKNRSWNKYNGGLNIADILRPEAARLMNEELARIDSSERVEHESYAARGIDKIPTEHVGVAASAMERKGIKTNKGRRNRYVDWLNQIHAENLRQVETHLQDGTVADLIAGANARKAGDELFKDWDALFAMLRDTRRCRAAMRNELGKLAKVVSAYEEGNADYLRWCGYDPESDDQLLAIQKMQNELRVNIRQMDITENLLLDSEELYKAHNKAVYASKKKVWVVIQINWYEESRESCLNRLVSIDSYISHLTKNLSWLDIIFGTEAYEAYLIECEELEAERERVQAAYRAAREPQRTEPFWKRKEKPKDAQQAEQDLKSRQKAALQVKQKLQER